MRKAKIKNPAVWGGGDAKQEANKETIKDTPNITQPDYFFNTLQGAFKNLITESHSLTHGTVCLEVHFRDGNPYRYSINRQTSFLCEKEE
jgi:hypothetical protein